MPDVTSEVLIVHGRSDSCESVQPLKNLLVAAGYQAAQPSRRSPSSSGRQGTRLSGREGIEAVPGRRAFWIAFTRGGRLSLGELGRKPG